MSDSDRVSLTIQQYADRHQVSRRTVQRWIKAGRVPVVRLPILAETGHKSGRRVVRIEFRERRRMVACPNCGQEVRA